MAPPNKNPQLAAPGAGLPLVELLIGRVLFWVYRMTRSREDALAEYQAETEKILAIVKPLNARAGATPVLINRIIGIEDSSRFWSPYMVLHHLVIVDRGISGLLEALTSGQGSLREVKIADVKPDPATGAEILAIFTEVTNSYIERLAKLGFLKGSARHAHPWFGLLDAHGWHCLAAMHRGIHRRQLEAIMSLRSFWGNF